MGEKVRFEETLACRSKRGATATSCRVGSDFGSGGCSRHAVAGARTLGEELRGESSLLLVSGGARNGKGRGGA